MACTGCYALNRPKYLRNLPRIYEILGSMKLTRNKNTAKTENKITFPLLQCWNPMTSVVTIAAQVNGERVLCKISSEILHAVFPKTAKDTMGIVTANRSQIESAARTLIQNNSFNADGFIIINSTDLQPVAH